MRQPLNLLITQAHDCSYLPRRTARNLVVDPRTGLNPTAYEQLLDQGFRRSGDAVYRPHCPQCRACVPVRIPVARFTPNRSQRRCLRANEDLRVVRTSSLNPAALRLYARYLGDRHPDGGMDPDDQTGFARFAACSWLPVEYWHFLLGTELLACAVVDVLPSGFSAVYTVFDTGADHARRSLGTYAILQQIDEARSAGLRHVWLGYWIADCATMQYKQRFLPQQRADANGWHEICRDERPTP